MSEAFINPEPFRFWCQKTLPLVYDDSLSYYELLCKVVSYLNNLMSDQNALIEQFEEVKHYVENLDWDAEIKDYLDELVANGTMQALMQPYLQDMTDTVNRTVEEQTAYNTRTRFEVNQAVSAQNEYNNYTRNLVTSMVGHPFESSTAAGMTDTTKIYVYTGATGGGLTNGHWYYWDGTAWTDGGAYNSGGWSTDPTLSVPGALADAAAVGNAIKRVEDTAGLVETIHQYNFLQWDYINGFYNSEGNIVSHATIKSYIVPIPHADKYFFCNMNTSLTVLDGSKNFISIVMDKQSITSEIDGSAYTASGYIWNIEAYPTAAYIALPFGGSFTYLRSSTSGRFIPILPANSDSTCEDIEICISGNEILYPYKNGNLGAFTENKMLNIQTGEVSTNNDRITTGFITLKKGTRIACQGSRLIFSLRGCTPDGIVYINGIQNYTLTKDFFGTLDYGFVYWKYEYFAPVGMSRLEEAVFLKVVTPEEKDKNQWYGKDWYCYGTSLSDIGSNDAVGNNGYSGKYPLYIDEVSGMTRHNGAIGSGGIRTSASHGGNVLQALLQTPYDVDLVTLECLPNDGYESNSNVGNISDTGTTTICGAFKTACEYITTETRAVFAVIFVTGDIAGDAMGTNHQKYIEAKDKLKAIAAAYGVVVIDAEKDALNWGHRKTGETYADTIHLNYLGGEIYGSYIWEKIKEIQIYPDFQE